MNKFLLHIISGIIRIYFLFKNHRLFNFLFLSASDGDFIILSPELYRPRYLAGDGIIKDLHNYNSLKDKGKKVAVKSNLKNINSKNKKSILFQGSKFLNTMGFDDHSSALRSISRQAVKEFDKVSPNFHEACLWENKGYMHEVFEKNDIPSPKTHVMNITNYSFNELANILNEKVFLIKKLNSRSSEGIYKISSNQDLEKAKKDLNLSRDVILQKLVNMNKDLRVIIVNDEIVLHYWRINNHTEWKPTSTSHGSSVDFDFFPEKWRSFIMKVFYKLEIRTGAFDICWEADDLSSTPLFLEVSPLYQPNPKPIGSKSLNYGLWKKSLSFFKNGYINQHIETIKTIQEKFIESFLKER